MPQPLATIPVFFQPEMVALGANRFAPSAEKPAQVLADWQRLGLPIEVRGFEPVTRQDLYRVHDPAYVDGILEGRIVNGFSNRLPHVAASLPWTNGCLLAGAREALNNRRVACAPVSGFHHARHAESSGYCTFNGLIVTACALKSAGLVDRVAILDLDQHWGDGTDQLRQHWKLDWIPHETPAREGTDRSIAASYLRRLPALIRRRFQGADLLIYQAGADAHVDDPLGGWMTGEQLAERDRIVFETAIEIGLPVVWNLAGGYQRGPDGGIEPVLAIHRATMQACAAIFVT